MEYVGRELLETTNEPSLWGDKVVSLLGPHGNVTMTCSVNPKPNVRDMVHNSSACPAADKQSLCGGLGPGRSQCPAPAFSAPVLCAPLTRRVSLRAAVAMLAAWCIAGACAGAALVICFLHIHQLDTFASTARRKNFTGVVLMAPVRLPAWAEWRRGGGVHLGV
jgi:hypothetical protein